MNKQQHKKHPAFFRALASYSALGGALIGSMNQAQATIQYATLAGTPVSAANAAISVPAGTLTVSQKSGVIVSGNAAGGVELYRVGGFWIQAVDLSFSITNGLAWSATKTWLAYSTQGPFPGAANKYMAFRFNNGGTMNYGWVRIDVAADGSSFTLFDYAYQDDGTAIMAGDKGPLPVTLLSFDAKSFQNAVDLLWETANEINFDGFSLERAEEGGNFSEIAWLPGTGNSDEPQTYKFRDEAIFENKRYYYRLKSIDIDGSFEYSQVVEVAFSNFSFTVKDPYPNPTSGNDFSMDIQALYAERISIQVFSSTGQMMIEQKVQLAIGSNVVSVYTPHLSAGIYFVKINGRYYSKYKRLVVE